MSLHYLEGRYASGVRPVAWVTSGAPVEILVALGYFLVYPENHAALCGARRRAQGLSEAAEQEGYSRDLCSYARTDLGSVLSGETPVGRLPPPDLLVCCTNICQTVLAWYRVRGLDPNEFLEKCFYHQYASIFMLDPLPFEPDEQRVEDFAAVTSYLDEWHTRDYHALGYKVVRVPALAPDERLAFVLGKLSEQGSI